mmetsp:Transcript_4592/g.11179  ORF Transcript_4592/g.11179 Transcript_4592/m.11179 type:complete len:259 (+) Transcript_4592:304-1080(+)
MAARLHRRGRYQCRWGVSCDTERLLRERVANPAVFHCSEPKLVDPIFQGRGIDDCVEGQCHRCRLAVPGELKTDAVPAPLLVDTDPIEWMAAQHVGSVQCQLHCLSRRDLRGRDLQSQRRCLLHEHHIGQPVRGAAIRGARVSKLVRAVQQRAWIDHVNQPDAYDVPTTGETCRAELHGTVALGVDPHPIVVAAADALRPVQHDGGSPPLLDLSGPDAPSRLMPAGNQDGVPHRVPTRAGVPTDTVGLFDVRQADGIL